ncbi:Glycosyl hydrolases family 43 [compost metagenome]
MMENRKYVFSYFKEEDEKLFLAYSQDGYVWKEARGGMPLWESGVGTGKLRDPFLLQDREGVFHLVWTDGWRSCSIGYARSRDLIQWTDEKLIPVMEHLAGTQNAWAPEIFYDTVQEAYRIIWSSTVGEGPRNHRIYSALTKDFEVFSEGRLFFDPGYNVIDATVRDLGESYLMLFKDERGTNEKDTPFKAIRSCLVAKNGHDRPQTGPVSQLLTPALTEGPTLYETERNGKKEWVLLADGFQEQYYAAYRSTDLANWEPIQEEMDLPKGPRHGSVMRLKE